jgi:ABC-type Mn2+/Zn2+ transport system permease subunit
MIVLAIGIALLAGLAGLYCSYYLGTAGGASIALAIFGAYLLSLPIGRLRAVLAPRQPRPQATIG